MTVMVTGGAGYIGSHVAAELLAAGHEVVVVDNLSTGLHEFVPRGAELVRLNILDTERLAAIMMAHRVESVVHLAGYKYAGESVIKPLVAYGSNVTGTLSVLGAMRQSGVRSIVFSSSAAVYGTLKDVPAVEHMEPAPRSPYGVSKLMAEIIIQDAAKAYGLTYTSFRYFNVAGSGLPGVYDVSPFNLFPSIVYSLAEDEYIPTVWGTDYETRDGTCVRDYVHPSDIARAHVTAAEMLLADHRLARVYNLGSGTGVTVREVMNAFRMVTGISFEPLEGPRRPGDPASITADSRLAMVDLGWEPTHSLNQMASSAWTNKP